MYLHQVLRDPRKKMLFETVEAMPKVRAKDALKTGFVQLTDPTLYSIFSRCFEEGYIKQGDDFVDLGSGLGKQCFRASLFGLRSTGIELNPVLHKRSMQFKRTLTLDGLVEDNSVEFVHSSYFPPDFIQKREEGRCSSVKLDSRYSYSFCHPYDKKQQLTTQDIFHPLPAKTPIDFRSYVIFFAYLWPEQMPSIMELFAFYALHNSTLVITAPGFIGVNGGTNIGYEEYVQMLGLTDVSARLTKDRTWFILRK